MHPDKVIKGGRERFISQKVYNKRHLIRVVYEVKDGKALVITFYPAKWERHENQV